MALPGDYSKLILPGINIKDNDYRKNFDHEIELQTHMRQNIYIYLKLSIKLNVSKVPKSNIISILV